MHLLVGSEHIDSENFFVLPQRTASAGTEHLNVCYGSRLYENVWGALPRAVAVGARFEVVQALIAAVSGSTPRMLMTRFRL